MDMVLLHVLINDYADFARVTARIRAVPDVTVVACLDYVGIVQVHVPATQVETCRAALRGVPLVEYVMPAHPAVVATHA